MRIAENAPVTEGTVDPGCGVVLGLAAEAVLRILSAGSQVYRRRHVGRVAHAAHHAVGVVGVEVACANARSGSANGQRHRPSTRVLREI